MIHFILRRLLQTIPTLFVVSIAAFSLIRLVPGDPVLLLLGERGISPTVYHKMQAQLGLDRPWLEQYGYFLWRAMHGDLGVSIVSHRPVVEEFCQRFPATIELSFVALVLATLIGVPLGLVAAAYFDRAVDALLMATAIIGYSMPIFWWALILISVFSVQLGWLPVSGRVSALYDVVPKTNFIFMDAWWSDSSLAVAWSGVRHLVLPALVLATIPLAALARMTRAAVLEVMGEDYIRTARAKGLTEVGVLLHHAFRNALIPVTTVFGLMVGTILTGAVLTESIFSWPGIGSWLVKSVTSRDYPVLQGALLLIALMIVTVNLLADIAYVVLDPRLRE